MRSTIPADGYALAYGVIHHQASQRPFQGAHMKWHGLLVLFAFELVPVVARAQTVTEKDFIGTWEKGMIDSTGQTMWPGSTDTFSLAAPSDTTWRLIGDTLVFYQKPEKRPGQADTVTVASVIKVTKESDHHFLLAVLDPKTKKGTYTDWKTHKEIPLPQLRIRPYNQ